MKQQNMVNIISFTSNGNHLARNIRQIIEQCPQKGVFSENMQVCVQESRKLSLPLREWCRNAFAQSETLIFIGAVGIAVRLTAAFIRDKYEDPAVLVVDELGRFVIPILSGHVGGANEFACFLAQRLGAVPVITTATDLYGKFAVDVFAAKNGLYISDRLLAKKISAAVLEGEKIGFYCEKQVLGVMPKELVWSHEDFHGKEEVQVKYRICVSVHRGKEDGRTLYLYPRALVLGIGCRKGKSAEEIETFVQQRFEQGQFARESLFAAASVDLKKQEQGIIDFCEKWKLSFHTFSPERLAQVPGNFMDSAFVADTVGVGNVCERAAAAYVMELTAETARKTPEAEDQLIQKKTAEDGMTLAVAEADWSVKFE
ncbi:MAG: cobalt-precorrin 5A hydrolase [Lachnospiraceae bacterium]|nr:cobalt-precorrin 5A hydrolase [Lachnospiraceae bacterium]